MPAARRQPYSGRSTGAMDLTALARRLALAFASGESNSALAAAVDALLPSASYVRCVPTGSLPVSCSRSGPLTAQATGPACRVGSISTRVSSVPRSLCLCGSAAIAVATSNLAAQGFMTQSLLGTDRCPCLVASRPQLVPASRQAHSAWRLRHAFVVHDHPLLQVGVIRPTAA